MNRQEQDSLFTRTQEKCRPLFSACVALGYSRDQIEEIMSAAINGLKYSFNDINYSFEPVNTEVLPSIEEQWQDNWKEWQQYCDYRNARDNIKTGPLPLP